MATPAPMPSLIKYDPPVLVTTTKKTEKKPSKPQQTLKKADMKAVSQTEDILNSILPPREWTDEGQLWVQHVSSNPATRLDVINLQEQLDQRLQQRQARETGICPVREELYAQTFGRLGSECPATRRQPHRSSPPHADEIIRQVTINCAERGLLLLRVRDEIRMTIAAYQTLYESSIAFGMRKALQAEQGKADMEARVRPQCRRGPGAVFLLSCGCRNRCAQIKQLEGEKKDLERQVLELKAKAEAIEKRESERRALEEKKHSEEIAFLKRTNASLKRELETYLSPSKKA